MSVSSTVHLTTSAMLAPAAVTTAFMFVSAWRVCSAAVSPMRRFSLGCNATQPETYTMPFAFTACEYGPTAAAWHVWTHERREDTGEER